MNLEPKRIQVIEDEAIIAMHIRRTLSGQGYEALEAVDSLEAALAQAAQERPELALVDIGLHGRDDGVEIGLRLRRELDVAVVFLTALTDELLAQKARDAQPYGYLTKPFDPRALQATIETALHRHHIDRELRASEERYRYLFENMAQGVVYQDEQGRVTSANPAALRILGVAAEEVLGRTSMDPRWGCIRADGSPYPGEEHPAMLALRGGHEVRGAVMGIRHAQSGELRWILVNSLPRFEPGETHPSQVFSTFDDITALREARRKHDLLVRSLEETLPVVVARLDRQGRHLQFNSAVALDLPLGGADLSGKTIRELGMPVEQLPIWEAALYRAVESGESQSIEYQVSQSGALHRLQTTFLPEKGAGGGVETVLAVTYDRTRRPLYRD